MENTGYYSPGGRDFARNATATPSPQRPAPWYATGYTQERPQTRAHMRTTSTGEFYGSSRGAGYMSPRYTSTGHYATATGNVSHTRTSRKPSFSGPSGQRSRRERERRNSYSYYRASDFYGESDEDEYIEINGITYVLPAASRSRRYEHGYATMNAGGHGTDYRYYTQSGRQSFDRDFHRNAYDSDASSREHTPRPTRRNSQSVPQRPMTTAPGSSHKKSAPPPTRRPATEADAKRFRIPAGYSLKNWDPEEEPIMLLGSVFDANSLGKWIYDWTVYHHGPATPISDMAGELWLLLINLSGKIKKGEDAMPKIRAAENKDMVEDFIESGDRLTDKLRKLMKTCEAPMLKAAQKSNSQLGKDAGVEFVRTLFGRERELEKTERFMQSVRLWNLRFDANCTEILEHPTV